MEGSTSAGLLESQYNTEYCRNATGSSLGVSLITGME